MTPTATEYEFHPLAEGYPLMSEAELDRLADSIEGRGQEHAIVLYNDRILDGRNRYLACKRRGIEPRFVDRSDVPERHLPALLEALNEHRRHLTPEQRRTLSERREAAKAKLKATPEASDRQVAGEAGLDPHTVAKVRQEMQDAGEIAHVEARQDTKGRKQPARKKRTRPPKEKPAPARAAGPAPGAEPEQPPPQPAPPAEPPGDEPVLFPDPPPESPPPAALGDPGPAQLKRSEHERVKELADDEEDEQLGLFLQSLMDRAARVERVRCAQVALRQVDRFPQAHMALRAAKEAILALG